MDFDYKVIESEEVCKFIKDGTTVGFSGFTPAGYPKEVPHKIAENCKNVKINVYTGASVGEEIDTELVESGLVDLRMPYITNRTIRKAINKREVRYIDVRLGKFPEFLRYGFYKKVDLAVVEACAINEKGFVPTTSVGPVPTFVMQADKVIIELNAWQLKEMEGMHDIFVPGFPPRTSIPINQPWDRIGTTFVPLTNEKKVYVVNTNKPDKPMELAPATKEGEKTANYLVDFFIDEVKKGMLPRNLLPLQSGVGNVANTVTAGLGKAGFKDLSFYTEVFQDGILDLADQGLVKIVSATSISLSPGYLEKFRRNMDQYKEKLILRPQGVSNCPEVIHRLGVIAMNGAIEADICSNVNSTHVFGRNMQNGIGGSGDFTSNGYLAIFFMPSTRKDGKVSCVVPRVSHIDHTEHDVDVILTEQGLADLRGLDPWERAEKIIDNCAHPSYKDMLFEYLNDCKKKRGHEPMDMERANEWHRNLEERGSMLG